MKRYIILSELIKKLQTYEKEYGEKEIVSLGVSNGTDGQFVFYTTEDMYDSKIKVDKYKNMVDTKIE